jgi:hypothetical protein
MAAVREIIERLHARKVSISESTLIYDDLGIAGEDAIELLEEIHSRFWTRYDGASFDEYFPNETDAFIEHLARVFFGWRDKKRKKLTVGHLLDVIQRGSWFEPEHKAQSISLH